MKKLISGIKPTGDLTIGNYIGAIKQFIEMQNDYETYIFVADLHALTIYNDPKELNEKIKKIVALYLACGLDKDKNNIFIQSENQYHTQLSWILECNSYMGELSRMTQYKDKTSKVKNESIGTGLFTYPALMASDILLYDADVVPVGIDQKQHVELTRDLAERFNNKYGNTFKIPDVKLADNGTKIMDLQNPTQKMSKTSGNDKGCIFLLGDEVSARKKIMSAVTDSESIVKYDMENKPGISNLINIYSSLTNKTVKEIEDEFKDQNYGVFKSTVADVVCEFLTNLKVKYDEVRNSNILNEVLDKGLNNSLEIASKKYEEVRRKVGVGR